MVALLGSLATVDVALLASPADFLSFYGAMLAAREHADIYDVNALREVLERAGTAITPYPYLYPPFLAHGLKGLARLPLDRAHALWLAASVVASALSVCWSLRSGSWAPSGIARAEWRGSERGVELVLLAALLLWILPFRANVSVGQVNPIVLLSITLCLWSHARGRALAAGMWLAPAMLIKVTPSILLVFFLARRKYRTVIACAVASGALTIGTLLLGAGSDWRTFVAGLPERRYGATFPGLFPAGTIWNFAPAGVFARLLPREPDAVLLLSVAVTLASLVVAATLASIAPDVRRERLSLALFFPVMILASPLGYLHHLIYLLPAVAIWLEAVWRRGKLRWSFVLLIAVFTANVDWPALYERLFGDPAPPLATALNLYALLLLFGLGVALRVARPAAADVRSTDVLAGDRGASRPLRERRAP